MSFLLLFVVAPAGLAGLVLLAQAALRRRHSALASRVGRWSALAALCLHLGGCAWLALLSWTRPRSDPGIGSLSPIDMAPLLAMLLGAGLAAFALLWSIGAALAALDSRAARLS